MTSPVVPETGEQYMQIARRWFTSATASTPPDCRRKVRRDIMDLRLNGQTAIVTGASRGIGLAVTRGLVAEGVHVTAGALKSSENPSALAQAYLEFFADR